LPGRNHSGTAAGSHQSANREFGAINAVALELGHRAFEPFRIAENGDSLANCRILHTALSLLDMDQLGHDAPGQ
jgi:hypothetical protein